MRASRYRLHPASSGNNSALSLSLSLLVSLSLLSRLVSPLFAIRFSLLAPCAYTVRHATVHCLPEYSTVLYYCTVVGNVESMPQLRSLARSLVRYVTAGPVRRFGSYYCTVLYSHSMHALSLSLSLSRVLSCNVTPVRCFCPLCNTLSVALPDRIRSLVTPLRLSR
ncbi:hypothetical protein BCV70DRAFT_34419 [Testicularia cyperi]|uniref:Uncharacterized protein n=1 Tax=Testicularia cyperi TaxID=1882483 RepID=A0A317XJY9_9BASI|nr:hypothetical protein BCV70DRAFT_34419 [Testicularia cyperi]